MWLLRCHLAAFAIVEGIHFRKFAFVVYSFVCIRRGTLHINNEGLAPSLASLLRLFVLECQTIWSKHFVYTGLVWRKRARLVPVCS